MASMLLEDQIARNKRRSFMLVAFMFSIVFILVLLIAVAWGFTMGNTLPLGFAAVIAVLVAGIYIWISYSFSVETVLKATQARPVNLKVREEKLLDYKIEELSIAAGLPKPRVYIQESKDINAFATGKRPEQGVVCVTTAALHHLNQEELEGVLAHEMSHIANRDILLGTVTVGVVGAIALLAEILLRSVFWGGGMRRGGDNKGGGILILVLLVVGILAAILAPLVARLTYLAMNRKREYLADATGAHFTRNPHGLAAALRKIQGDLPDDPKGSKTAAALYIANPFKRARKGNLWATHPPLDERIRRLERM